MHGSPIVKPQLRHIKEHGRFLRISQQYGSPGYCLMKVHTMQLQRFCHPSPADTGVPLSTIFRCMCTLLMTLFLAAGLICAGVTTAVADTFAPTASPIRIGSCFAKTGPAAAENSPNYRIARLAVKAINDRGGVLGRPLEIIEFDTMSTPLGARQAASAAVAAGVVAVVGPSWSSQAMAMGPVLQEAGIPMIGATTTAPEVTRIGNCIFRVCYTDDMQAGVLALFARSDLKARSAVIVTIAGDVYSEGLSEAFRDRFTKAGGIVAGQSRYLQNAMNFSEQVDMIRQMKPDVVFVPGYTRDSGLLLKQARGEGLTVPFLGGDGWTALEHYPYLDPARGENFYVSHWHPAADGEENSKFVRLLHEEFGPDALSMIDAGNANAYDAVGLLADAIVRAQSVRPEDICRALAETERYEGVTGSIRFSESRDPVKPIVVLRITPGKVEFVRQVEPIP